MLTNPSPFQNPQNKSVAKSFRYMRRKPTIIAFKTPSSDNLSIEEVESRSPKGESRESKMEEGRFEAVAMTEGDAVKYPVGKPLEVSDGPDEWLPRGARKGRRGGEGCCVARRC